VALVYRGRAGPESRLNEEAYMESSDKILEALALINENVIKLHENKLQPENANDRMNSTEIEKGVSDNADMGCKTAIESENETKESPEGQSAEDSRANDDTAGSDAGSSADGTSASGDGTGIPLSCETEVKQDETNQIRGNEGMTTEIKDNLTPAPAATLEDNSRQNDIFLNPVDMLNLLKKVPYIDLVGYANGTAFSGRDQTKVMEMAKTEMESRKNEKERLNAEEKPEDKARQNDNGSAKDLSSLLHF